ncbi:MAG: MBL fold metallo-hydrolase [Rikenellaceae bacterium]
MIKIETLVFNPFHENTYILSDESGKAIIVDAGNNDQRENQILDEHLASRGLTPIMALNTHGHIDHILGIDYIKNKYNVPFALDSRDKFLVENAPSQGAAFGFNITSAPEIDMDLAGVSEIKLGEHTLQIIETPGHTPGHISIYDPQSKSLLTGDTLFRESIGRTDLPGGDYKIIMQSILQNIVPLGDEVKVYPGHGPSTSIGHEVLYNPFVSEVIAGEVN